MALVCHIYPKSAIPYLLEKIEASAVAEAILAVRKL